MHLELLSVSTADIIPLEEMSVFLRVDDQTQNALIASLVRGAMNSFQEWTGRQLLTATYKMTLQCFPNWRGIRIPKPPFASIVSVGYYATAGVLTTLTETTHYQVVKGEQFSELIPAAQSYWPSVATGVANGVEIVFTCGYGVARSNFEEDLIHSLKVLAAHRYENREASELPDFMIDVWRQWHTGEQG